ncbi:MAG TPA: AMP-binding protein, partial [Thermoanaerobaculia bacterium]|nr:AMP-binding protein [Thermoanaerobaculia bacterium]
MRSAIIASPEKRAFTFLAEGEEESAVCTYAELDGRARAIGALLHQLGAEGERVLLLLPPGLDLVASFFGCLYAGAVAVPVFPPRSSRMLPRLQAILEDARPTVALTTEAVRSRVEGRFQATFGLEGLRWRIVEEIEPGLAEEWRPPAVGADTLAFLQYTSGTTSVPKGVMVSHGNLLHNEQLIQRACGHGPDSVFVSWLPLYHDLGLIGNVLQSVYVQATCVLMAPVAFLQRPYRWLKAVSDYRGTTSGGPNFAYDLCVRKIPPQEREGLDLSSWQVAFNGAEPVRRETLERFAEAFGSCGMRRGALYPCYGLAESTLMVSGSRLSQGAVFGSFAAPELERNEVAAVPDGTPEARSLVSSGRPLEGLSVVIADPESGTPCPAGRVGEIWVSGASVAHGYWNRPEETRQAFGAFLADSGEGPYLRTGDLGFLHDGELFVSGRLKDLLIIRGRNLYPQDIELTVERSHGALVPGGGAAFAMEGEEGEERLVVVHEVEHRGGLDLGEIAEAARRAVAEEHEVQLHELVLIRAGTILKTTSGKIQRRACRRDLLEGRLKVVARHAAAVADEEREVVDLTGSALLALPPDERPPVLERFLREVVARVARVAPAEIQPGQPLTGLGLDSLAALELRNEVEARLGTPLSFSSLLEGAGLAQLAGEILEEMGSAPDVAPLRPSGVPGPEHPLSHGQEALWYLHRLAPESAAYNLFGAVRIPPGLDAGALERAFQALAGRHEALRTTFESRDGQPFQRVHPRGEIRLRQEDGSGLDESGLRARLLGEALRPFDLENGPLLRASLFSRPDGGHVLLVAIHHIVADFWSLGIVLRELAALYGQEVGGSAAELPSLPLTYTDYIHWQRSRLAAGEGERLWEYWRERLAGAAAEPLELPLDRPRPPAQTFRGASVSWRLDAELSGRVKELGRSRGATLFMTLAAAFQALLCRHARQRELVLGAPTAGRSAAGLAGLVGYFVNPVALRVDLADDPSWESFLDRVRASALGAFAHQDFPFPLLVERLQPSRDLSRSPLFQAAFVLQKAPAGESASLAALALGVDGPGFPLGGLTLEPFALDQCVAPFDLTLVAAELDGRLGLSLQYAADLFDAGTIQRMAGHLGRLLAGAAAEPGCPVLGLPLLTEPERQQLVREWNATPAELLDGPCLHEIFAAQAARSPEAVAVVCEGERLSYGELDRRANRLAWHLLGLGVSPGDLVGLCLERSLEMLVAILGVLKTGSAYVPFDPAYPRERLAFMLADSRVPVLLAHGSLAKVLPEPGPATRVV